MTPLEQACHDIIMKNMNRKNEKLYLLHDQDSPLATIVSQAYITVLRNIGDDNIVMREFDNPPQPLYRGGFINQENPHSINKQTRIITSHNIDENKRIGLNHHEIFDLQSSPNTSLNSTAEDNSNTDEKVESIKNELISLPAGSIVILVQSTNFRLSTFRIRLELFHRGIHVVEHNHLSYIPEAQFATFIDSLQYRTDEYTRLEKRFLDITEVAENIRIKSVNGQFLTFGPVEKIRGNTGDYTGVTNKGGTFPIGEVFTEAKVLSSVNGRCLIDTYPREDFSIEICKPFEICIEDGRVLPTGDFPSGFQKLYDWVIQYEGEMLVRELGFGLNPAISTNTPLRDINFHERKMGVHLSLGKKHGIFGKKLPKTEIQRFHIDVFIALDEVYIDDLKVFEHGRWCI